jgi:hypothetical protein
MTRVSKGISISVAGFILARLFLNPVFAGPVSEHFELKNYGFGSGGIENASSSGYKMLGVAGEQAGSQSASETYKVNPGLIFTNQANLPAAPAFINPGSTYDRLKLILENGDNATDAAFAVAITGDNWTTTKYVQNDFTVGDNLGSEDWLTYSQWNGLNGRFVTGLAMDTVYRVKVKARQGKFTETGYSAEASATTGIPTLTFGVSADTVNFDQLSPTNSWTDNTKQTTLTTSTNAYFGYTVFAHESAPLTNYKNDTIDDYAAPNSNPTSWTGKGFGYTTSDSNLTGGTANRFTGGGPKFAGFNTSVPGDPVADHLDYVADNPVVGEQFNISYRVTADENQPAGSYKTNLIYVVVPEY